MEIKAKAKKLLKLLSLTDKKTGFALGAPVFEELEKLDIRDGELAENNKELRAGLDVLEDRQNSVENLVTDFSNDLERIDEEKLSRRDLEDIKPELKGDKGDDYVLTSEDKKEIAENIEVPVVEKVIERTEIVREQPIVTEVIKEVAVADTPVQLRDKLEELKDDARLDKSAIRGIEDLENQIKEAKNIRFGGTGAKGLYLYLDEVKKGLINTLDLKAGTGVSLSYSKVNGLDTITIEATGSGTTVETPPETPNAVITEFTVSAQPKWVVADGTQYFEGAGYSYAALKVTMNIPPSETIRAII